MQIGPEHALDIIQQYCADEEIAVPKGLARDFRLHIGEAANMTGLSSLKIKFCARVREVLKEDKELGDKYGEFFSRIQSPVRLRMIRILGLEEYVTQPMDGFEESPRDALISYLESLPHGQTWNTFKIERFHRGAGVAMQHLRTNLGAITRGLILDVLGDGAEDILAIHPFQEYGSKIANVATARRYLMSFLGTIPKGESWSPATLARHGRIGGKGGPDGDTLRQWIVRHYCVRRGKHTRENLITEETIRKVLGPLADTTLAEHPFEVRNRLMVTTREKVAKYLKIFIETLPAGTSWSPITLETANKIDGNIDGYAIYRWIDANEPAHFSNESIRAVLGNDADRLLARNPFGRRIQYHGHMRMNDVSRHLALFVDSLPPGEAWSPYSLQKAGRFNPTSPTGPSLYNWISHNIRDDGKPDWLFVITKLLPESSLQQHPFVHHKTGAYLVGHAVNQKFPPQALTPKRQLDISERDFYEEALDQSMPTPEEILTEEAKNTEEARRAHRAKTVLNLATEQLRAAGTLTREEDTVLTRFTMEEDVDPAELNPILQKLRQKMREIDPGALH